MNNKLINNKKEYVFNRLSIILLKSKMILTNQNNILLKIIISNISPQPILIHSHVLRYSTASHKKKIKLQAMLTSMKLLNRRKRKR